MTRTPRVVVLTSLAPDHLDWHGGVEAYYRDKLRLVEAGPPGRLAVNAGNDEALARTGGPSRPHAVRAGRTGAGRRRRLDRGRRDDGGRHRPPAGPGPPQRLEPVRSDHRHPAVDRCGAVDPGGRVGRRHLRRTAVPLSRARRARRPDLRGRRPGLQPVRRGDLGRVIRRSPADRHRRRRRPGCRPGPAGGRAGRPPPHGRGGGPPPDPGRLGSALDPVATEVRTAADLAEAVRMADDLTPQGGVVLFSPGAPTPEGGGGYRARSRLVRRRRRASMSADGATGGRQRQGRVDSSQPPGNGG